MERPKQQKTKEKKSEIKKSEAVCISRGYVQLGMLCGIAGGLALISS
jgi:hypothetical protein